MKTLKYALAIFMTIIVLLIITLVIVHVVHPNKIRRLLILASSNMEVFVDRLKGSPYTVEGYDGIDVSKHNGVIKWDEVAKNENVKFVYIKATEGKNHTDHRYSRNIREARKAGLMWHLLFISYENKGTSYRRHSNIWLCHRFPIVLHSSSRQNIK